MNNLAKFQFKSNTDGDRERRESLEKSRLSALPKLPPRKPFNLDAAPRPKAAAGCISCGGRLDPDDTIQQSVKVCRKCFIQYATIDAAIDEAARRKRLEMLERFTGGK